MSVGRVTERRRHGCAPLGPAAKLPDVLVLSAAYDGVMPDRERLSRSSFRQIRPIVQPRPMTLPPERVWSDGDWERIQAGYRARDMDEKWNVFAEQDVVLLHRSWTGHGIYEARFVPVDGGGRRIAQAVVEGDPQRYRATDQEYNCVMLELVLSAIVLGEPAQRLRAKLVDLTRRRPGGADAPAAVVQHSALGLRSEM